MPQRIALSFVVALFLVLAPASFAHAEDGRGTAPSIRPPEAVLRHVDAARTAVPAASAAPSKELVVLVGGYQSCSCQPDPDFETLRRSLEGAGFDVVQFGTDPRYPYDTYGHIAPNAVHLRDEVRSFSNQYDAIHIVAHSMGGVVADQAFAAGLSADDGVVSFVSLASPHSGSDGARAMSRLRAITGHVDALVRKVGLMARIEPESDAASDLATVRPIPAPRGVVRLDVRESGDAMVSGRDARDPGVTSRVIDGPPLTGHADILTNPDVMRMTLDTMIGRRVPLDARSRDLIDAAQRNADQLDGIARVVLPALVVLCVCVWLGRRSTAPLVDPFLRMLPWPKRRGCP